VSGPHSFDDSQEDLVRLLPDGPTVFQTSRDPSTDLLKCIILRNHEADAAIQRTTGHRKRKIDASILHFQVVVKWNFILHLAKLRLTCSIHDVPTRLSTAAAPPFLTIAKKML